MGTTQRNLANFHQDKPMVVELVREVAEVAEMLECDGTAMKIQ
jgi:hypothetical protein